MDNNKEMIEGLVSQILDDYHDDKIINQQALFSQPDKEAVCDLLSKLIKIMYPGYFKGTSFRYYNLDSQIAVLLEDIMYNLRKQVVLALPQNPKYRSLSHHELVNMSEKISNDFFKRIPKIRALVETDVAAFFDGDPAAYNYNEIITKDKTSLDIFWIKDKSLTDLDNLPDPDVLANEIIENIESGLNSFREIMETINGNEE